MGNVYIDQNAIKVSERIDPDGNIINPRTKQIIQPIIQDYQEPENVVINQAPQKQEAPISNSLTIQEQIDQAKENLAKLQELKKLKIAQMEAELELLKQ